MDAYNQYYSEIDSLENKKTVLALINKNPKNVRATNSNTQSKISISLSSDEDDYETYSDTTFSPSDSNDSSDSEYDEKLMKKSKRNERKSFSPRRKREELAYAKQRPSTSKQHSKHSTNSVEIPQNMEDTSNNKILMQKDRHNKDRSKERELENQTYVDEMSSISEHSATIGDLLKTMNAKVNDLSKSTAVLEQEIALCRKSPFASKQLVYSQNTPPINYIGKSKKQFSSGENTIFVPTRTVIDAVALNEILEEDQIFKEAVSCFSIF